jgi:hypothetical protein
MRSGESAAASWLASVRTCTGRIIYLEKLFVKSAVAVTARGGDKYIFNLSTNGLSGGTWALTFTVSGDPTPHSTLFQLR